LYYLHKLFWLLANPLSLVLATVVVGIVLTYGRHRKLGWGLVFLAVVVLSVFSMPITAHVLGHQLEGRYQEVSAKAFPHHGDVVLDLGGSIFRSWYAAELVKAGKAPTLIPSAENIRRQDVPLIRDLGVAESALWIESKARNTEENIKLSRQLYLSRVPLAKPHPKVLLVTSAVHMPRSCLLMEKYWPEAETIPAPTDFQTMRTFENGWSAKLFQPQLSIYVNSEAFLHEYLGYAYYKWLRK